MSVSLRTNLTAAAFLTCTALASCAGGQHAGVGTVAQIEAVNTHAESQAFQNYSPSQRAALTSARADVIRRAQATLPSGTRIYTVQMFHVSDPVRHVQEDFPSSSLITRNADSLIVTPPNQAAVVFSPQATIDRDPSAVMYVYVRPGETPDAFVKEHAKLDHIK